MLYGSYFDYMSVFNLLTAYVQYNLFMCMSRVTSSYFAKYFCDTYSEYITPCVVMTYATPDDIRVTHTTLTGYGPV
jgi:hypothetical protein